MRHRNRDLGTIRRMFNGMLVLAIMLWTGICAGALARHAYDARHHAEHMAHQAAIENVEKDLLYRHWAASHGGVYVPVSEKTRPNPYLSSVKERDVTTPSGRQLTLVNPAYMTRQVYELAKDFSEIHGHITSLNLLRPEHVIPTHGGMKQLQSFKDLAVDELGFDPKRIHILYNGQRLRLT